MTAGKNHLLRHTRIYINAYDLSGDARSIDSLGYGYGKVTLSGVSEPIRLYIKDGVMEPGIFGLQSILNDAASGAFTVLKALGTGIEASVYLGGGAAPAAGDLAYLLPGAMITSPNSWESAGAAHKVDIVADPAVTAVGQPIGRVLLPKTALTGTTTGSTVNYKTAANGWGAMLHVFVSSGGTWAFKLQDSANGTDWADVSSGAFTANGSALASEYLSGTGELRQYVRAVATRTSGTCTAAIAVCRL